MLSVFDHGAQGETVCTGNAPIRFRSAAMRKMVGSKAARLSERVKGVPARMSTATVCSESQLADASPREDSSPPANVRHDSFAIHAGNVWRRSSAATESRSSVAAQHQHPGERPATRVARPAMGIGGKRRSPYASSSAHTRSPSSRTTHGRSSSSPALTSGDEHVVVLTPVPPLRTSACWAAAKLLGVSTTLCLTKRTRRRFTGTAVRSQAS